MKIMTSSLAALLIATALSSLAHTQTAREQWFDAQSRQRQDVDSDTLARVQRVTALTEDFAVAEPFERNTLGSATSKQAPDSNAFSHFLPTLTFEEEQDFKIGNAFFRKLWVSSPASTLASDGLGPLFNARACQSCHFKDGRGHPPSSPEDDTTSFFLRLALKPTPEEQAQIDAGERDLIPEPVYGGQLQDNATQGYAAEARVLITYETETITLADGVEVHLQKPHYAVDNLGYGPMSDRVTFSPRVANPMIGLGLVEAIPAADIVALADPHDHDGDGISGKASVVQDHRVTDSVSFMLGRFGWKASMPTVEQQSAGAFAGDIGISTDLFTQHSGDCTEAQVACMNAPHGAQPHLGASEAPGDVLNLVTFYAQNLAVPQRRDVDDEQVLAGKQLFYQIGCVNCHQPKFVTSKAADNQAHAFQLIWPYSDFLLHDMGEGLADDLTSDNAHGNEWRTPPLWGIGLTEVVNGHTRFLHDGRARNLLEAVLWHDGEAAAAQQAVVALPTDDREALIAFLNSL